MMASVSAEASQMVKSVHAEAYTQERTGTLTHSVRFDRHFYRKGSPVYGAQSLGNPTKMYVYLGHDTVDQRLIPDRYYTNAMHLHHHYYRHHAKAIYQIRPHYSNETYKRLFKRLVREMETHGMHYDSSNETGKLRHKGRYIELTETNTGVVTNGLKALWPDQALKLLHKMYGHAAHHYYRPIRHHLHKTRAYRSKKHKSRRIKKHTKRRRVAHRVFKDSNNDWLDKETATMQKDQAREDKAFAETGTASSKQYQQAEHIANEHSLQD